MKQNFPAVFRVASQTRRQGGKTQERGEDSKLDREELAREEEAAQLEDAISSEDEIPKSSSGSDLYSQSPSQN